MTSAGSKRQHPLISVIIPVLHEEASINRLIDHLCGLGQGPMEIIVVDGDPSAGTIKAITRPNVVTDVAEKGRASQMNRGAMLAAGDILAFLHADTLLPPDALMQMRLALLDGKAKAGAFDLGIRSGRRIFRITERYAALRTRLTRIPFGDQCIFINRRYFWSIGGYPEIPLMEDVELMKRIRESGDRIRVIPGKVMTSPRRWEREGILYCTVRNLTLQLCYGLGVSAERLEKWYRQ